MKKILVTARSFGQYSKEPIELLEKEGFTLIENPYGRPLREEELTGLVEDVDGIIAGLDPFTAKVLHKGKKLRVIVRNGVGMDNVDRKAAQKLGIHVFNTPGCNQQAVAELTVGLMMDLARQMTQAVLSLRNNEWRRFIGCSLTGKTFGIIGLGNIGREVIRILKGFHPTILAYDPYVTLREVDGVPVASTDLTSLLHKSDFVTLHVPLLPETRGMLGAEELAWMKKDSVLINTSRGGIVDEEALYECLINGRLAGAALDAFEKEPPFDSKLLRLEQVIATPHIGAYTHESMQLMGKRCAEILVDFYQNRQS